MGFFRDRSFHGEQKVDMRFLQTEGIHLFQSYVLLCLFTGFLNSPWPSFPVFFTVGSLLGLSLASCAVRYGVCAVSTRS